MAVAAIKKLVPSMEGPSATIRSLWDRLSRVPGGKRVFSQMVGRIAPYTGTIGAIVEELEVGHARVTLRDRRAVRNHLRCVHAIALLNLAELTGNVALAYSMPDDARFIVAGMSIDYLKKARGTITGECTLPPIDSSERREIPIEVELKNAKGELVSRVSMRTLIGPKRSRDKAN